MNKDFAKRLYQEGIFDYFDTLDRIGWTSSREKQIALKIKLLNIAEENRSIDKQLNKFKPFENENKTHYDFIPQTVGEVANGRSFRLGDHAS